MTDFLADSYAFVGLFEGNERYVRIFRHRSVVTTALNVLEVYATLLRRIERKEARSHALALIRLVCEIPSEVAIAAGEFRQTMRDRHRDCSYIDAWGYASAQALGVRFLTGDPGFKGLENVEFVR
ncbi:MAG: PIN domain-containing protein [Thermoplasmata archaeon]|nr:PIN domain-containing protein [Thermoplasmata archaeon]